MVFGKQNEIKLTIKHLEVEQNEIFFQKMVKICMILWIEMLVPFGIHVIASWQPLEMLVLTANATTWQDFGPFFQQLRCDPYL